MPVVINGSTGISGVDGSAGTPAFQGSDANTGIRFGTDIVSLVTGGSDRLYIDSSGRLGIGTSSPVYKLHVSDASDAFLNVASTGTVQSAILRLVGRQTSVDEEWNIVSTGSGLGSNALRFVRGSWTATPSMIIDSSGQVGINNLSPQRPLDINGSARFSSGAVIEFGGTVTNFITGDSASNYLAFGTNSSERARIDSSGRLLVGTTSGAGKLIVQDSLPKIQANFNGTSHLEFAAGGSGCGFAMTTGLFMTFNHQPYADRGTDNNLTERMRITSNGNVFINSSSNPAVGIEMFGVAAQSSGQTIAAGFTTTVNTSPTVFVSNTSNTTNTFLMRFASGSGGTTRGEIYYNGSQLVYATSSDYRLKENIQPFGGGIEIVKQLRPVKYNWIENGNEDIGFIAHEVQEVFPNAVGGEKDAVDEDGKTVPQTYDPSKLVPLLTAALQEAISEIESLKARLSAAGI